ncbi:MAG: EthD family reductase [Pseudomonadota bacterium]|nr:EthD family reductase [Pseudomonadota bacterium]
MTASYIVRYHGTAADKADFLSYYRESHAPILKKFPGIGSLILHHGADFSDPFPVNPDGNLLIAEMTFEDLPALHTALTSSARAEARDDFGHFPPFDGDVTHQAFVTERVF